MRKNIVSQFPVKGLNQKQHTYQSKLSFQERMQMISKEGVTANNVRFYIVDWLERLNMISKTESAKVGLTDNRHVETLFNRLFFDVADLRKLTCGMTYDNQVDFGNSSDKLFELLMEVINRTDESGKQIDLFLDYIRKFEIVNNLNMNKFL